VSVACGQQSVRQSNGQIQTSCLRQLLAMEGRAEEGVAGLAGCCEASRSSNGFGGLEVFGPRKNCSGSTTATKLSFAGRASGLR